MVDTVATIVDVALILSGLYFCYKWWSHDPRYDAYPLYIPEYTGASKRTMLKPKLDIHQLLPATAKMAIEYLMAQPPFASVKTEEELKALLDPDAWWVASAIFRKQVVTMADLSYVCQALGADIGLTISLPSGEDLTFFAEPNISDINKPKSATRSI